MGEARTSRLDERAVETEFRATAPLLDSTSCTRELFYGKEGDGANC